MRFVLYQRDYCHLCDLALAELAAARAPEFESVFIDDVSELEPVYGTRVPVFRDTESGSEIGWPFDAAGLSAWLASLDGLSP